MDFRIRPAGPDDHAALVAQFHALNLYEDQIAHDRRTDRKGGAESFAAALALVEHTGGSAVVAEDDGGIIGFLFLAFREEPVFVRAELRPYAYVSDLFVCPRARGAGVGAALMREAERLAAARGYRRIMVGVLAGNLAAEGLYRSAGYAPYATEMIKQIGA